MFKKLENHRVLMYKKEKQFEIVKKPLERGKRYLLH